MSDVFTIHTLANGLRIVVEEMPHVRSAAVGFLVDTGARDETPELAGVSHFLEHMMFKGTSKRHWRDITVEFDRMGSTYNAYTSEDRTMFYGWVRTADLVKQIELLADMLKSTLPPEEFDMEKNVVLEEIAMSGDHLEHVALDFIQEKLFAGHPLSWPVLGYDATVRDLTRDQMYHYFQQRYVADNIILVVAGDVDPKEIIGVAEELCGDWPASGMLEPRQPPTLCTGVDTLHTDRFKQQMVSLSFPAVPASHDLAETACVMEAVLGGENSRIFWNIIQQGISPRAGSYYMDYSDCGVVLLYGTCEPDRADALVEALRVEGDRITNEGVNEDEVARVKNRRRTSLAVEIEVPYRRLSYIMDDMQYRGQPRSADQALADIEAVSKQSVEAYLEAYPLNEGEHFASIGPLNGQDAN